MARVPRIGAVLGTAQQPAEVLAAGLQAEQAGFDELWVSEDYFYTGGIVSAASLLASTSLPVGIGVAPVAGRHPALLATELATLAGMYPGRLHAGIGAGIPELNGLIGFTPRSPLGSMRNALQAVRALLNGETYTGEHETFVAREVSLEHPPANVPPLYLGVSGPKALRLSGTEADGTVLSVLSSPEYVRWARERLAEGGAGREHRVVAFAFCAVDRDRKQAREVLRELVAFGTLLGPRNTLNEAQGIADEAEELSRLGIEAAAPLVPDEWIERMTVSGTPEDCADGLRALADAGADAVALFFPPGTTEMMIDAVAREVLPQLEATHTAA